MTPHEFLDALMQLASRHRFRETSGYRSPLANGSLAISGKPYSAHQYWLGRDVILDPGEDKGIFMASAERVGLWTLDERDHIHLQPLNWRAG